MKARASASFGFALVGGAQLAYFIASSMNGWDGWTLANMVNPLLGVLLLGAGRALHGLHAGSKNLRPLAVLLGSVVGVRMIDVTLSLDQGLDIWMVGLALVVVGALLQAVGAARGTRSDLGRASGPFGWIRMGAALGCFGSLWYAGYNLITSQGGLWVASTLAASAGWAVVWRGTRTAEPPGRVAQRAQGGLATDSQMRPFAKAPGERSESAGAWFPLVIPVSFILPHRRRFENGRDVLRNALCIPLAALLIPFVPSVGAQAYEPPSQLYRDFHPVCDLNGDSFEDIVTNDWQSFRSDVQALSGKDGSRLWGAVSLDYFIIPNPPRFRNDPVYTVPFRPGLPAPKFPTVPVNLIPGPDVNGDRVCDFFHYGVRRSLDSLLPQAFNAWDGSLRMLSGKTGAPLWEYSFNITERNILGVNDLRSYPTGLVAFESPSGPKFALKLTDLLFDGNSATWIIQEHVLLGDARTGERFWERVILRTASGDDPVQTWLTGAANLGGDGEFEILLDEDTLNITALRGELNDALGPLDDALWGPVSYFRPQRLDGVGSLQPEGDQESLVWSHVQVVGDVTGDGHPEPVGLYLVEGDIGTTNGRLRTHIVPLDGGTGELVWKGQDVRYQGWGFVSDLNPTSNASKPYLAFAAVDVPTLSGGAARFPAKDVRLTVLNVQDGTPFWSYRDQFPVDSYLSYHIALNQFLNSMAPRDWNDDGVRDLITPARYLEPKGAHQVLMSTRHHEYQVLSGLDGSVLKLVRPWGPIGMMVPCAGQAEDELTVLSGHARRLDVSRLNTSSESVEWRRPVYSSSAPEAQTASKELSFLGVRCGETPENRTMFGVNAGILSIKRGREVLPLHGFVLRNGTAAWVRPNLAENVPVNASIDIDVFLTPPSTNDGWDRWSAPLMSLLPGVAFGLAVSFARNRRRRSGGIP